MYIAKWLVLAGPDGVLRERDRFYIPMRGEDSVIGVLRRLRCENGRSRWVSRERSGL